MTSLLVAVVNTIVMALYIVFAYNPSLPSTADRTVMYLIVGVSVLGVIAGWMRALFPNSAFYLKILFLLPYIVMLTAVLYMYFYA